MKMVERNAASCSTVICTFWQLPGKCFDCISAEKLLILQDA
jgi:hypothetical protein